MFEPAEIKLLLAAAGPAMRAMILLGAEPVVSETPIAASCPWAPWTSRPAGSTCRAPKPAFPGGAGCGQKPFRRFEPPSPIGLSTKTRNMPACCSSRSTAKDGPNTCANPMSAEFRKLAKEVGLNGSRGFYCLRRGFETVGGESQDQVAVDAIMGHVNESMAATYRQGISDERLKAVAERVRAWFLVRRWLSRPD